MKVNKVAPWEGRLEWIDNPRNGTSKKGRAWTSVDFVLKFVDDQDNERFILFNAFGDEKVNTICSCKPGTKIRIAWRPDAREYNGRWFCKLEAYDITMIEEEKEEEKKEEPKPKQTELPLDAPVYSTKKEEPEEEDAPDADLPFSKSPGVRG